VVGAASVVSSAAIVANAVATATCGFTAGLVPPTAGEIRVHGRPVRGPAPNEIAYVFQENTLFPWNTILENIKVALEFQGVPVAERQDRAQQAIEAVGLSEFAHSYPHQLSGGMKQRVAIARVLANDAEVVLMDEPFGALDAMTRERLQDELVDIWSRTGLTVIFVTHSIEEATFLADRVVVMSPGPGRIDNEYRIDLPRPRDIASPEFNEWRRLLSSQLHSHHGRKAG